MSLADGYIAAPPLEEMTRDCRRNPRQLATCFAAVAVIALPSLTGATTRTRTPTATPGPAQIRIDTTIGRSGELVPVSVFLRTKRLPVVRTENVIRFGLEAQIVGCLPADDSNPETASFSFFPPGCRIGDSCDGVRASVSPSTNVLPYLGLLLYTCDVRVAEDLDPGRLLPLTCESPSAFDAAGSSLHTFCEDGAVLIPGPVNPPVATPEPTCVAGPSLLYDARFDSPDDRAGEPPRPDLGPFPRRGPSTFLGRAQVEAEFGDLRDQPLVFSDGYTQLAFEVEAGSPVYRVELDLFLSPRLGRPETMFTISIDSHNIDFVRPGRIDIYDGSSGWLAKTIGVHEFSTLMRVRVDVDYSDQRWRIFLDNEPFYEGPLLGRDLKRVRLLTPSIMHSLGQAGIDNLVITGCREVAPPCPGDCDQNGAVTIDELIFGVRLALTSAGPEMCSSLDKDGDGTITVDDLVWAVNAALEGCVAP